MSLAAAAGLLLGAGAAVAPAVQASMKAARRPAGDGTSARGYRKRDGWSAAQDRRNTRNARNQARNRAAHR